MIVRHRVRKQLASFFLLTFLLAWAGNGLALPVLSMVDDPHNSSLTFMHGEIHLVLHHPEDQHGHEHEPPVNVLPIFAIGQDHSSGHEIHLQNIEQQAIPGPKKVKSPSTFNTLKTAPALPGVATLNSVKPAKPLVKIPQEVKPALVLLSTTFLLI